MKLKPADIAFSQCIREAADHTCLKCGIRKPPTNRRGSSGLDCSHVYSRRHKSIRWDVMNAKALCTSCHRDWHGNPAEMGVWYTNLVGEAYMDILRAKRNTIVKISKQEEKEIAKYYREMLVTLETRRLNGETGQLTFVSYQ